MRRISSFPFDATSAHGAPAPMRRIMQGVLGGARAHTPVDRTPFDQENIGYQIGCCARRGKLRPFIGRNKPPQH